MDKKLVATTANLLEGLGIYPPNPRSLIALPRYLLDRHRFLGQLRTSTDQWPMRMMPMLSDRYKESGALPKHYFLQDLIVAQRIYCQNPRRHLDVGSRLDGFVAHVASFRDIDVMDIRPLCRQIPNVNFIKGDLLAPIPKHITLYDSLSCLHTIEHLGLGRYGDTIDYNGYRTGLNNLANLLEPSGRLYLSFPIGPQVVLFNMHRIFSLGKILKELDGSFEVAQISYIDDFDRIHIDVHPTRSEIDSELGCEYGLAILELIRR